MTSMRSMLIYVDHIASHWIMVTTGVARTRTFPPYLHLIEPIRPMGSATTLLWLRPPVRTSRLAG